MYIVTGNTGRKRLIARLIQDSNYNMIKPDITDIWMDV